MKVLAGSAKGRNLKFPKLPAGKRLRPLTGQVKAALFNILVEENIDSRFLDLFAGTGSVGIEALSRGAKLVFFVELERKVVETLRENLATTGFSDRAEVLNLDVIKAISVMDRDGGKFDIIFIGAPYNNPILIETLKKISGTGILAENGVLIAEHNTKTFVDEEYGKLKKYRDSKYGDTILSFYSNKET